jgi:hypothetical protein
MLGKYLLAAGLALGCAVACGGSSDDNPGRGGAGTGGTGGTGATGGTGGAAGAGGSSSQSIFDVWRAAQLALRQSPDHLTAKADALVKQADPATIHAFVRDEIATYPPSDDSMYGMVTSTRWGVKATLRGGAGTPREKCELLVDLYAKAGLEAEVVAGPLDTSKADGKAILLRETKRTFAPVADDATKASWLAVLKKSAPTPGTALDLGLTQTQALASSIAGLVTGAPGSFDFSVSDVPLVRVKINGAWQYANPVVPGAAFGDSATTDTPNPVSGPYDPQTLSIKIEASRSDAPYDRFTLVEGSYGADQVAGRRINVSFSPSVVNADLPKTTFQEVSTFIPVISVDGADVSDTERDALAVIGKPVTLGGNVFDIAANGDVSVDGALLGQGPSDPAAVASVQSLGLGVRGDGFRRVDLRVSALNAAAKNVPNLRADAFQVLEDGKPMGATLTQNDSGPPRVILLQDVSSSIPGEYLGAGAVDFGTQIITPLYAKYPSAEVRVGIVNYGVIYAPGSWATSQSAAQAEVDWLSTQSGSSELYQAAADAEDQKPTVIILVSDGDSTDTLDPVFQAKLAGGAPVLGIGVGTTMMDSLTAIAKLSGGTANTAANKAAAISSALGFVDDRAVEDYQISYRAPKTGNATRNVTINFDNARLTATGSYDVPTTPAPEQALSSIYLTVRVGDREATRVLAGYESSFTTAYSQIPESAIDDVQAMLFGRLTLEVEGAGVSPSEWLDDWLGEKLRLETAYDALLGKDATQIQDAAKKGFTITPPKLFAMSSGLPGAGATDALTFEHGPRVAAVVQKVRFGKGLERQMDVFSHGLWNTAAQDPNAAWQRTLQKSAYVATAEASLHTQSTKSLLASTPLSNFVPGTINALPSLDATAKRRWSVLEDPFLPAEYALLAPSSGTPFAFWAVHTASGSVIGVMPDGSGGAIEDEANANLDQTNHILDLIGDIGSLAGADVGFWVKLEKTKAAKLTAATIVIAGGQADIGDWPGELGNGICDAISDGVTGQIPGMEQYENLQEAVSQGSYWSGMGEVNLPDVTPDICP